MKVAITGSSGFIGSVTCRSLAKLGHEVVALVRETSRRAHIEDVVDRFVVGDQADVDVQKALIEGCDAVIHNSVNWSARDQSPANHFRSNVLGSLDLLENCRQAGVRQFIFVSSVAALTQILPEWNGQITEDHPTYPSSTYGAYKAAVEPHLKAYHLGFGMNTSAWRPAAVYGVDPELERSQWYNLVKDVIDGRKVDTPRGGKITHVQDVADALALAVGDEQVAGEFFNLVDGYLYWQLPAEFAAEITGSKVQIVDRRGSGPKNQFDCAKAIAFFNRHGNGLALRRGPEGVRKYVQQLVEAINRA
ncbi:MAG: NAD-dependent epimerase/dehydratase family protein [Phycisphaerae bacterium]